MKIRWSIFCLLIVGIVPVVGMSNQHKKNEAAYNAEFCASVGGRMEVRHEYTFATGKGYVQVDCETNDTVYEGGLDKRSSLDSLQQALFFSSLTDKQPAVVIYDTDGHVGKYEHRIRVACEKANVRFLTIVEAFHRQSPQLP